MSSLAPRGLRLGSVTAPSVASESWLEWRQELGRHQACPEAATVILGAEPGMSKCNRATLSRS
eukprot:7579045-Alexandrium_andersonii.AAC.1